MKDDFNNKLSSIAAETLFDINNKDNVSIEELFTQNPTSWTLKPLHKQPYARYQRKTLWYRALFAFFAALFLTLAVTLFNMSLAWSAFFFLLSCSATKAAVCSFCLCLAVAAAACAFLIDPHREAVESIATKAQKRLKRYFKIKLAAHGIFRYIVFFPEYRKAQKTSQFYQECEEKLLQHKDTTLKFLDTLTSMTDVEQATKARLYNHALFKLEQDLDRILCSLQRLPNG